ncbi:MAG: argininosuccinate synthase [bacterium]|nr:argininosuccinate synthase [bacterium]
MAKKIVVAYSGGLDTSIIIHWLKNKYNAEIIAYTSDLGQGEYLEPLKEKAIKTGASKIYIEDLREEFVRDYVFPSLRACALYENKYPLATALGRPLIAKRLLEIAKKEKADAVAHGCTGKGNDQVRFEATFAALNPAIKVIAPLREWELKSREEEIDYAIKYKISVDITKKSPYSIDRNLWGVAIECGSLEDPWKEPPEDAYQITTSPSETPNEPRCVEIYFEKGIPKKIKWKDCWKILDRAGSIETLNTFGGHYGVGRIDMVENRLVGIKSREIYEAPAAVILHNAHNALEELVLDRETMHFKEIISQKYAEIIYYGLWHSSLKEALDEFVNKTQENVTGTVKVKLYKGTCTVVGRKSKFSLYSKNLATYTSKDTFDHKSAKGFIDIWSLPLKVKALLKKNR